MATEFCATLPPNMHARLDFGYHHLVQAHMLANDESSIKWFADRGDAGMVASASFRDPLQYTHGHYVILDNGAWELGEGSLNALTDVAKEIHPHEVVVPDHFRNKARTLALADKHMGDCAELAYSLMLVPQGEDIMEWCECAVELWAMANACNLWHRVCFGIPKVVDSYTGGIWAACAWLEYREMIPPMQIHLLGVWAELASALSTCRSFPFIRTLDTTMPYAYALHDQMLYPSSPKIQLTSPEWKVVPSRKQLKMAEINIAIVRKFLDYGT